MTPLEAVPTWVFVYAALFVLVHLLVGYYVYRRSDELGVGRGNSSTLATDRPVDADHGNAASAERPDDEPMVRCGNCDAENDPGYRYCQHCVQELPSVADQSLSTGTPDERESL